jgi:hypothetical protein
MDDEITILPDETNGSDTILPENGSKPDKAAGPGLKVEEQDGATETIVALNPSERPMRRATGPRTELGKRRASLNATKHGVFSRVTVLKGESRAEYESLLKGLWEALQPEGTLEEVLVEKLATILWRHRRLIVAEGAEIRKNVEFLEWDHQNQQQEKAEETGNSSMLKYEGGLIRKIQNPGVLKRCLELLAKLRQGIETDGFAPEQDNVILERIYGEYGEDQLRETLYDTYVTWLETSRASEEERQREGYASPQECVRRVLQEMDREIRGLKRDEKTRASINAERNKLEILRRSVPNSPGLDRLLRYEASLDRALERTLSQLERLQRMRRGQPVPPTLKVELSG